MNDRPHLLRLRIDPPQGPEAEAFPFSVPALRALDTLELDAPVTCFVGENGSGKSTLLEGLAAAVGLPTVGGQSVSSDPTLEAQRRLGRSLRLAWSRRTHRGFFLRAEDFFGFARKIAEMRRGFREDLADVERRFDGHSDLAKTLAAGPAHASLGALEARYDGDLDARSHGESFLTLFRSRLVPEGLYLLDEPEAALSPQSQLAFLTMMREAVDQGGQFVLATHSPILMAVPGAGIYSFDRRPVGRVEYDELDSIRLLRDFLEVPERFLRHIWT